MTSEFSAKCKATLWYLCGPAVEETTGRISTKPLWPKLLGIQCSSSSSLSALLLFRQCKVKVAYIIKNWSCQKKEPPRSNEKCMELFLFWSVKRTQGSSPWGRGDKVWAGNSGFWTIFSDIYKQWVALAFTSLGCRTRRGKVHHVTYETRPAAEGR